MLSGLVIAFFRRSKGLLISWLQSPSAVILEPTKIKSVTVSTVSSSVSYEVMGPDAMIFIFWMLSFKPTFFIPIPKKSNGKECPNYCTIALISQASKVMFKILQARLQQYMNRELPDVQAGFRRGRGTRYQIANICWIIEKAREFQKNVYFCFIDYQSLWLCGSQQTGKFWKRWKFQTTLPASWEICMQVKSNN